MFFIITANSKGKFSHCAGAHQVLMSWENPSPLTMAFPSLLCLLRSLSRVASFYMLQII